MSKTYSIDGSAFVVKPMERHVFVGDSFECSVCARPRALHLHDGFRVQDTPHTVCMDKRVRYGRHPYFYKPKSIVLNKAEQDAVDAAWLRLSGRKVSGQGGGK